MPDEHFDIFFERIDHTEDGLHPGPKAHKQYAEKLKKIINKRFKKFESYKSETGYTK